MFFGYKSFVGTAIQALPERGVVSDGSISKGEFVTVRRSPLSPPRTQTEAEKRKARLESDIVSRQSCEDA